MVPVVSQYEPASDEVDLQTADGRTQFLQEIENLALSSSFAQSPEEFTNSKIFFLVEQLQRLLETVEQQVLLNDPAAETAVAIQEIWNELVEEVEIVPVLTFYTGELDLADLDAEATIVIKDATQKNPMPNKPDADIPHIHNRIDAQSERSASIAEKKHVFAPKRLIKTTEQKVFEIESQHLDYFDKTFGTFISPCVALADELYVDVKNLASSPAGSRQYLEFRRMLEQLNVKYDIINFWVQQFPDIEAVVDRCDTKTFQEVVFQYVAVITQE